MQKHCNTFKVVAKSIITSPSNIAQYFLITTFEYCTPYYEVQIIILFLAISLSVVLLIARLIALHKVWQYFQVLQYLKSIATNISTSRSIAISICIYNDTQLAYSPSSPVLQSIILDTNNIVLWKDKKYSTTFYCNNITSILLLWYYNL